MSKWVNEQWANERISSPDKITLMPFKITNRFCLCLFFCLFWQWPSATQKCNFQGWKFAHLISEQIARLLSKNLQMSDSLKKMSNSLICSFFGWAKWVIRSHRSFPLSHLSKSLMVAHFWWAKLAICSHCSFDLSQISISLTVAQRKWATVSEWANERSPSPGTFNFFYF